MHVLFVAAVVVAPARVVAVMELRRGRPVPVAQWVRKAPHVIEPDRLRLRRKAHRAARYQLARCVAHELARFLWCDVPGVVEPVVAHRAPEPIVKHLQSAVPCVGPAGELQSAVLQAQVVLDVVGQRIPGFIVDSPCRLTVQGDRCDLVALRCIRDQHLGLLGRELRRTRFPVVGTHDVVRDRHRARDGVGDPDRNRRALVEPRFERHVERRIVVTDVGCGRMPSR